MRRKLEEITKLRVYEASICEADGVGYFMARKGAHKLIGCVGTRNIAGQKVGELDGRPVFVAPADHAAAEAVRKALRWAKPRCIGLDTSLGFGDRLGLATPGHVRALVGTGLAGFFAQQSIREMTRTRRSARDVMDAATWGVVQEGYRDGFGSDADHLQQLQDIDTTVAAGFTMFTIDPSLHVVNEADDLDGPTLTRRCGDLDFDALEISADDLRAAYVDKTFPLVDGTDIRFDEPTYLRAAVKYGRAIAHTVKMHRHLCTRMKGEFELEVSVDETESPTSPAEHYFFAAELKRLGVEWVSMAPRFVGRFEKGVDYIGDLDEFRKSFSSHVAVMRTLGPYKISIHSGSDKFSIYPIVAELTGGLVHLKTAGTSYLEAIRAVAGIDPPLFRAILDFARSRYETDKATYHVSADLAKVPESEALGDDQLDGLLDDFDARQVLHVTFGSVLTAEGGEKFKKPMYAALERDEDAHYAALAKHLRRHAAPFGAARQ